MIFAALSLSLFEYISITNQLEPIEPDSIGVHTFERIDDFQHYICTAKSQTGANQLINHFITSSHQTVKYIMLLQFENPLPFIVANYWTPMALYKKSG